MAGCLGICASTLRAPGRLLPGVALALIALAGSGAAECTHAPLAEFPMIASDDGIPIVSLKIDGTPREVLLDTGGFWSLLDPSIAASYPHYRSRIIGQLGLQGLRLTRGITVPSIEIGDRKIRDVEFFEEPPGYIPTSATLGANLLSRWDVDIDPAARRVIFFPPTHCRDEITLWPRNAQAELPVTVDPRQHLVSIPLMLDGHEVKALIDTGSPETFLSARAAKDVFGIEPDPSALQTQFDRTGRSRDVYRHRFHALELGGITFKDPWLIIAPMAGNNPEMVLGMHDLGSLHLYFAYGEHKLYASTLGGDRPAADGAIAITNVRDRLLTAEDALKQKDNDGAMAALDKAVQGDSGNAEAYLERAQLFSLEGQRDKAFDDANRAVVLAPESALGYIVRSELETLSSDPDRALADASRAIALAPKSEVAYAARAEAYAAKGEWDRAMQDSGAAIRVAPRSAAGYLSRSHIYELSGDYAHALEDADQAVHVEPRSAIALNARCWNGAILARLDMALDDCNAAVALKPYSAEILDSRAFVNLKAGKYDMALADYSAALAINPRFASSLYGRGLARQKSGDPTGGKIDIAAALAIDPRIAQRFGK